MSIISIPHFLQATRDSGYKSTSFAIAELVDNSLEAGAKKVQIQLQEAIVDEHPSIRIFVKDDGEGMSPEVLFTALQFGGSSRFNSRNGTGRYGMGLPNSSVSQSRRVDVYTWQAPGEVWWSYLDIDEITQEGLEDTPIPVPVPPLKIEMPISPTGTIVEWSKCDRLEYKRLSTLLSHLRYDLGRMYRYSIWDGKKIYLNGELIKPHDPLFIRNHQSVSGASLFGGVLSYDVVVPMQSLNQPYATVNVQFTELPIEEWHSMSNSSKNRVGIAKGAGVSIVRGKREIASGWFFMGNKRKENYDDWWRCEIQFEPYLDELFGITHNKQTIRPLPELVEILSADLEKIARLLNNRVRQKFIAIKQENNESESAVAARKSEPAIAPIRLSQSKNLNTLGYKLKATPLDGRSFFLPILSKEKVTIILNEDHPFFQKTYLPLMQLESKESRFFKKQLELLLFASARTELSINGKEMQEYSAHFREKWSDMLAAFLS